MLTQLLHAVLSTLPAALGVPRCQLAGPYAYTERNTQKYLSTRLVWSDGLERARKAGATETRFVNQYGSYTLKLDFMVQVNTHTGTTRPVRYVS